MGINEEKYKTARQMLCRYVQKLAKEKKISQTEIAKRTGFKESNVSREFTAYGFKHTGVIRHFLAGFDLRWLQDQTGHKDISNLMKYLRSLGLKVNRAINIKAPMI
jgi:integrase